MKDEAPVGLEGRKIEVATMKGGGVEEGDLHGEMIRIVFHFTRLSFCEFEVFDLSLAIE